MPGLFETGDTLRDIAMDTAEGGISAGAGRYVYQRAVRSRIQPLLGKVTTKYIDVASSYVWGLALKYLAKGQSGKLGVAANIAAYTPIGDAIGVALGDAPMTAGSPAPSSSGNPWGSLAPQPLTRGQNFTTSPR